LQRQSWQVPSLLKRLSPVRSQMQPVSAPASTGFNNIQAEPVFAAPSNMKTVLPVRKPGSARPAALILIPQGVDFGRAMGSLTENLKGSIRFRCEGNNWDGVRLSDIVCEPNVAVTQAGKKKYKPQVLEPSVRICDSDTPFDRNTLLGTIHLRIEVRLHFDTNLLTISRHLVFDLLVARIPNEK
jgi:hypothetical protein